MFNGSEYTQTYDFKGYQLLYEKRFNESNEFQDFVCIELIKKGIVLSNMSSKKYQIMKGENVQGFEIKHDKNFRRTKNLYIEYEEKGNIVNENYVVSGINRYDNSWIWVIGDYQGVYLIQKKVLMAMHEKGRYKYVKNGTDTSKGFLLPVADADIYFNYIEFELPI